MKTFALSKYMNKVHLYTNEFSCANTSTYQTYKKSVGYKYIGTHIDVFPHSGGAVVVFYRKMDGCEWWNPSGNKLSNVRVKLRLSKSQFENIIQRHVRNLCETITNRKVRTAPIAGMRDTNNLSYFVISD